MQGTLVPAEKLNEPELARRFGISRGPLREAIRCLEARRLVAIKPNAGASVVDLDARQLIDLYTTREALEGMAARLAAQRMERAEIDALARLLDTHETSITQDGGQRYFQQEGDVDFHFLIATGADNTLLKSVLTEDLYQLMRMYRHKFSTYRSRPAQALKEHHQILDAIRAADGELAELLMRRHVGAARQWIETQEKS